MDDDVSCLTEFWTSLEAGQPYLLSQDYTNSADSRTLTDSVAYGSEQTCYQPPYGYSYALVDDAWDKTTQFNSCDNLMSYQELRNVLQADLCSQVTQEHGIYSTSELPLSSATEHAPELPPALVEDFVQMEGATISDRITQEIPKETSAPPNVVVSSDLPTKKYRRSRNNYAVLAGEQTCSFCERSFNRPANLTQHIKAQHSGTKKERCDICGKRFHLRLDLEIHELHHKAENKRFTCMYCPIKFYHKPDVIRHQKAAHTGKPWLCKCCGKGFVRMDHLRNHEKRKAAHNALAEE